MKVSPKKFIKIWQTSDSFVEVVRETGMTKRAIKARGKDYKKRGIPLKELAKSKVYDWDDLRGYAAEFVEGNVEVRCKGE